MINELGSIPFRRGVSEVLLKWKVFIGGWGIKVISKRKGLFQVRLLSLRWKSKGSYILQTTSSWVGGDAEGLGGRLWH